MIAGESQYIEIYKKQIPKVIYDCLKQVMMLDLSRIKDGNLSILGYRASLESPFTEEASYRKLEGHKKFIDLVYLIKGEERIGIQPYSCRQEEVEAYPDRDLYFYKGKEKESSLYLTEGSFIVCFPEDLHRPLCKSGQGIAQIRKMVVKIPLESIVK
ncbi:YhcH/YjgK/YiaL family protein [Dialister pneumosintes]|jgi:uncharacterized protein, YhcH/YjgK/YiaL family|uniref:YhcH/YjgK/YiaL family protein n=1 Tax=Dialister pneumosintes TaxID=39950 RepID=A0A1B3WCS6_9FIRM|nr:YhcH/YjgK/YiaL family protein [Dialister pneumosintes]AOH38742.1 hypothetical protein BCB69_01335 [Dialister pneumosintes]RID94304.1 YhcH/YjgK/YiaL family protein [Dialister pneumosintes]